MMFSTTSPFDALINLQRALENQRRSDWFGNSTSGRGTFPLINVFQKDDDHVIVAELPGVDKTDLDIQAKGNVLRIVGKRTIDYGEDVSVHRRERLQGRFDRSISLPGKIDAERIQADYRNGVLAVFVPRAESDKPKSISIN